MPYIELVLIENPQEASMAWGVTGHWNVRQGNLTWLALMKHACNSAFERLRQKVSLGYLVKSQPGINTSNAKQ